MKKIFQLLCLITMFSFIFFGCQKDGLVNGNLYTPYAEVVNPPDSFVYYIPLSFNTLLQGKIQFSQNSVWKIVKTQGFGSNTWLARTDNSSVFTLTQVDTVALQGNLKYEIGAFNSYTTDGVKIYMQFTRLNLNYSTFSPKY